MEQTESRMEQLPVIHAAEARAIDRAAPSMLPVPAKAAATGGIVVAATYLLFRILRRPTQRRATLRLGKGRKGLEIQGSRSFLVDVHMLKR